MLTPETIEELREITRWQEVKVKSIADLHSHKEEIERRGAQIEKLVSVLPALLDLATSSLASASAGDGELIARLEVIAEMCLSHLSHEDHHAVLATIGRLRSLAGEVEQWKKPCEGSMMADELHKLRAEVERLTQELRNMTYARDTWKKVADGRTNTIDVEKRASRKAERDLAAALERVGALERALADTAEALMEGSGYEGDPRIVYETAVALLPRRARTTLEGRDG